MPKLGNWITLGEPLGRGGQGTAYRAIRVDKVVAKAGERSFASGNDWGAIVDGLSKAAREPQNIAAVQPDLAENLDSIIAANQSDIRVIKILHQGGTNLHDIERLKKEIVALSLAQHPNIQPIYDADLKEGWYVTEFYESGSLYDRKNAVKYQGQALQTLKAILPLVQALKIMHDRNIIHRDIKTQNIFVRNDGALILGDLGLVFDQDAATRITLTLETVGSRDWMPPWLVGERLQSETIQPIFDMVGIAKVIYCLIAGLKELPLLKTHRSKGVEPESFDLEINFLGHPAMLIINKLLDDCIVMEDVNCKIRTADQMIAAIQAAIEMLESDRQFLPNS